MHGKRHFLLKITEKEEKPDPSFETLSRGFVSAGYLLRAVYMPYIHKTGQIDGL